MDKSGTNREDEDGGDGVEDILEEHCPSFTDPSL